MARLFGTDGVRGVANVPPMTPQDVLKLGLAAGRWFRRRSARGPIVVGRDTRLSGPMLEAALVAGLTSAGVPVRLAGVLPTPAVSFLTRDTLAAGGAVISASHNPFEDNGVKFFDAGGGKLSEADEDEIEALLAEDPLSEQAKVHGAHIAPSAPMNRAEARYVEHALTFLQGDAPLAGLRIVADCANGSACRTTPRVLKALGAEVIALNTRPNGININQACGSLHFDVLRQAVLARHGSIGLSHDGDADRVLMCDENGELVDGDRMIGLLARDLAGAGKLAGSCVVATILSNGGLEEALEPLGVRVARTQVGDRAVAVEMKKLGAVLGGEPSGHLIVTDHGPTGDGLLNALAVLRVMVSAGTTLAEQARLVRLYPSYAGAVRVSRKPPLDELEPVSRAIDRARQQIAPKGRVVVRYSGTEPVARVLVEGPEEALVRSLGASIEESLRHCIGA